MVTVGHAAPGSFQIQLRLQRFGDRQLLRRFANRRQLVWEAFATLPCRIGVLVLGVPVPRGGGLP